MPNQEMKNTVARLADLCLQMRNVEAEYNLKQAEFIAKIEGVQANLQEMLNGKGKSKLFPELNRKRKR